MHRAVLILLLFAGVAFAEGDWRQNLTPVEPGKFQAPRPFVATYSFGWSGFTAGRADTTFSRSGDDRLRLEVRGGTTGIVRTLWRLDASHIALADAATLMPVSVKQVETYRAQTLKLGLEFDGAGVTRSFVKLPLEKPKKPAEYKFQNLRDMHCALLFVRSQRLQPGDVYTFVVYPGWSAYLVSARVAGKEKLAVPAGNYNAIKVDLKLWRITGDFHLEPPSKCKHAVVWVSDDADRLPLRAQADVFVGSIWGEMQKVRFLR